MDKWLFERSSVQSNPHLGTAAVCTKDVFVKSNSCSRWDGIKWLFLLNYTCGNFFIIPQFNFMQFTYSD